MNLLETYNLLNEIYETQLKYLEDTDRYYHFFNDFSDMTSALYSGIIYSSFNGSDSQLDAGSKRFGDVGYTCMLKGEYGKKRIVTAINHERPFGVSFKDLPALCERSGYIFDADGFNQVLNKMSFDSKGKYLSPKEKITLRDFRILSIGKLADGRYFVTGGQGRGLKDVQRSTFFTDHELYKICKD